MMDKRKLPGPSQWLIEQCRRIDFGRLTFHLREGQPDLSRPWRSRRTVKLAGNDPAKGPRPETIAANFTLRREQAELLAQLAAMADGVLVAVEIRHGLPFLIDVEESHQAA